MKVIGLIPAAGMGKRMGAAINKQYLLVSGQPILARTIGMFEAAAVIDQVYLVIPEAEIDYCKRELVGTGRFNKVRSIVPGGSERQHSVLNGLRAVSDADSEDIVLIHDGVRPFVTPEILERVAQAAQLHGAALVAVPAKDTIKMVDDGVVAGTPARNRLWLAQTPQAFRYGLIREAHERAAAEGYLGTDDSSLVERMGKKVHVVMGDYRNIKITTPEDLVLAEAFLQATGIDER